MADNMQSQAMERLRQMYSKAQHPQEGTVNSVSVNPESQNFKRSESKEQEINQEQPKKEQTVHSKKRDSIAELFLKDKEKSLILLLIVLLMSEKAESSVVLALLYLIL